ncbi:Crp/Fnr family transcriptional regulator [Castellaniella hirudinis]|uniref:Crp/Fnr family transcriptional regulator n=1 Tax=Castellaniella hirudinis TaxID=1144617 RepID=UPI0039C2AC99
MDKPQMDEDFSRRARIRDLLAQVPLFNELPPGELDPIVSGTSELSVLKGEIVFRRGDPCVGFHVVVYGQIKLVFVSNSGVERVVRLIGPGDGFGEALMFMGQHYIVTAQALHDTLLLHVGREALFEQIDRNPGVARKMLAGLSRRLYSLMGDVEAYTLHTGAQRLIAFLLRAWPGQENQPFRIEISKSVIASRLNLTPEHFSRTLRELSERGMIRVRGREFTILSVDGLRNYRG